MKRWEERSRKEVASSYGSTSFSIQNALSGHLKQLAVALDSVNQTSTEEIARQTRLKHPFGTEHGHARARSPSYSIAEVIFEYRIFRQVTIQVLEEEISLSLKEREVITDLIEQAVNDAAAEFSKTQKAVIEQFTATLTHDLRNPMTAAKSSAELILRRLDRPDLCRANANQILTYLNRMDSMLQNLLDAGRIRAGQLLAVTLSDCDVREIANEVLDEMRTIHGNRFLLLTQGEIHAWWSCDLFRRALDNLVSNAVKYGDPKAPVTVRLEARAQSVKVVVHNEGSPIPEAERAVLFQEYHRSESAQASSNKGWGLGLTLVSGVVQAHGGGIQVESSASEGTSFIMVLPIDCRKP